MNWNPNVQEIDGSRPGLGGASVAALLHLDNYRTAYDVWLEATGKKKRDPSAPPPSEPARWGNLLEPVVRAEYDRRTGFHTWGNGAVRFGRKDREWHTGRPDGLSWQDDGLSWKERLNLVSPVHGFEAKTRFSADRAAWGDAGTSEVPDDVAAQCHWYMSLFDLPRWDVAVLFGGSDFRIYELHRDDAIHELLLDTATRFWNRHVVTDIPPKVNGSEAAATHLRNLLRKTENRVVDATPEIERDMQDYIKYREQHGESGKLLAAARARLLAAAIAANARGFTTGEATFKVSETKGRIDYKKLATFLLEGVSTEERLVLANRFLGPSSTVCRLMEHNHHDDDEWSSDE